MKLITWNDPDEMLEESKRNLEEIASGVFDSGIQLTFEFDPTAHDRNIVANNNWKIVLGRGLDIFQKVDGRLSLADVYQEKRQCKACEITYVKQ